MFWNNKNYVNNLNKIFYTCKNKPFIFVGILDWFMKKSLYLWFQSYSFFRKCRYILVLSFVLFWKNKVSTEISYWMNKSSFNNEKWTDIKWNIELHGLWFASVSTNFRLNFVIVLEGVFFLFGFFSLYYVCLICCDSIVWTKGR